MKDEENNTAKEKTAKKMKEASDDEETATKKTEGEANDDEEEEEETTKKMEEGSDLLEEETTTKEMGEANDPMEEDSATKTTDNEENGPKEEETAKEMEEERNPQKKTEAEGEPRMVNAIWRKEKMKGKIVQEEWKIPRIHDLCKFERLQVGSSSRHHHFSDEVIQEHRPVKIQKKQESGEMEDEIAALMLSLSESNVPEPECIEGMGVAYLQYSKLPQLEVDLDKRRVDDGPRRWRPPEKGWLKMNVEGLISVHRMATSAVVRDSDGGFLAAISWTFDPVMHVDTVKLLAVRNALLWAVDGGRVHHNYLVELDSEQVLQHLRDFASVYRLLPDDLRDLVHDCLILRMHFSRMQFASVSAGENRVAHCLASRALHHGREGQWLPFDAPDWLQEAILEDMETKTTDDEENDPKEEETAKKMEEERNPEKKMEAESEPRMVNAIWGKEKMKGKIVKDEWEIPRIHDLCKFEHVQAASSSKHHPFSDEVIQEHRPVKIHEKQESGKMEDEIAMLMLSLPKSNVPQPESIEGMGVAYLQHSKLPQLEVDRDERRVEDGPRRWRPPEKGWLKMNVEGLISEHQMATGAVIRDNDGGFLAATSGTFDPVMHIDTAKLIAVRNALLWAEDVGRMHHNYLVELDSEQVVQHLRDFASVYRLLPDDLRHIVNDCLTIRKHFPRMQFACVSAGENRVAHCLASRALHHGCEGEWYELDAPEWLQEAILEDLPN